MNDTPIKYAPLSARLLALFIDYIFTSSLIFFTLKTLNDKDYSFVITFFMTGAYFTFCNSELCSGQTLGKKVLGLKTISSSGKVFLDPAKSALRFFVSFGIIILLAEVPNLFYRKQGFVSSLFILELHMLPVMFMCATSLIYVALTGSHRSLHDIICKTIVVRDYKVESLDQSLELKFKSYKKNKILLTALSFLIAVFLWSFGVVQPKQVGEINKRKYLIEKKLNTEILSIGLNQNILEWISLLPQDFKDSDANIAKKIGAFLKEKELVNSIREIHFVFHRENSKTNEQNKTIFKVDTLEIK